MTRYSGNPQVDEYLPAKIESSGSDAVKLDSHVSTTHRNASPFIPDWKDAETFRRDVQLLNHQGFIHNAQRFTPRLTAESIIILVQVHSRPDQLQMLIDSFRKMRYINETLVIFSHDFYSQDVFDVIAKIDFCPYMQIFYPYAIQVYNSQFPGNDPSDCPRNIQKDEARKRKCNNAEYQDFYGHYREAPYSQTKHHFLWKLQFIFENCSLLRTFEGLIFRIEEDYYLAEDTIDYMRKLDRQARIQCPEYKMYIMGAYSDYSRDDYKSSAARKDRWYTGIGRGMAFKKHFWKLFKKCAKLFCLFDDYNWDWSLMHVTTTCIPGGFKILKPVGSRVFHIGICKGFHQNSNCKTADVVNNVQGILSRNRNYLFPEHVYIHQSFALRTYPAVHNGGWADIRDHEMCLRIFNNQSMSTEEMNKIHQKLFS
ncbi:alpha-1,6-mannosyl-glycoprotein 2-beta-N-acetylglucosaminyltransferase-like [Gigantopelta aegis]|uniref:alpha-1,6-mannosyl-glycoprotein 2-beta-N-acetylglucosaminyltransferase-like n=1 Tax=Gigantopelta aegis TaxID=1735272 RepID=UPI001B889A6B|nr:alpha-1,6-mannosyl-glycoprotein 2-beta-N-acetylglucosaminyltransferase-like [Gigantopelta aegis]